MEPFTLYDVVMLMFATGGAIFGAVLGGGFAVVVAIKAFDLLEWIVDGIERIRYRHERREFFCGKGDATK